MYDSFGNPIPDEQETFTPSAAPTPVNEPDAPVTPDLSAAPAEEPAYTDPRPSTMEEPWQTTRTTPVYESTAANSVYPPVNTGVAPRAKAKKEKKARRSGMTAGRVIALLLCCALIGAASGAGGAALISRLNKTSDTVVSPAASGETTFLQGSRESSVINVAEIDTSKLMTASEVYAANVNFTVGITTSITTNYFGYTSTAAAAGSGFIISSDGYIVTNYHVIEDSSSIKVTLYDGTAYDASIVGYDESNDLAVLKVDAQNLTPVILGDSDNLNVGDSVVAIGNPLGELTFSLTAGAVSALDRTVTLSSSVTMNLIQTDCAINSGNSGGALFNMYGEVIGITNAKYSSSSSSGTASIDNIGFAIPISSVRSIINSIIEKGYVSKPYIGVSVITVSDDAQSFGIPAGAGIQVVEENGPAATAGLQVNDVITECNGQAVASSGDLVSIISGFNPGDEVTFTVYRSGETLTVTVTIGEKIQSATANEEQSATQSQDQQQSQQYSQDQQGQQYSQGQDNSSGSFPFNFFGNGSSGNSSNTNPFGQ